MGRDLTKRYFLPSEKKGMSNPFSFLRDIYRHGKSHEFVSFMVWEAFHRFGLFPEDSYLRFSQGEVPELDLEGLTDSAFGERIKRFFTSRGLGISRSRHNWKLLFRGDNGEIFGCLYPNDRDLYSSRDDGESVTFVQRFPERIKSVFISSDNSVLVCIRGAVYKSSDDGATFGKILDLASSQSWIRHNNAMTETPNKTLVMGEYGNVWDGNRWKNLAYLYFSSDNGETWERSDFLIRKGTNKHVHLVKYSTLLDEVIVADGDNKKKLWVSDSVDSFDSKNPKWKLVNRFHIQMGGHTSAVESDERLFFGTDYQGGTNFIVETADGERFDRKIVPDPYRRSPIDNMVRRKSRNGTEIWALLPFSTSSTKSLLMYTADAGKSWNKVLEYSKASHRVSLLSSSNGIADVVYFSIADSENRNRAVYKVVDF